MSLDAPQPLPPEEPAAPPFPRLSIRDWFVGTFVCASLFVLQRTDVAAPIGWRESVFDFAAAAVTAAEATVGMTVLYLFIRRRSVRGFSAGHWLCLSAAVSTLGEAFLRRMGAGGLSVPWYTTFASLQVVALSAAAFAPGWLGRQPALWRGYFRFTFGLYLAQMLLYYDLAGHPNEHRPWIERGAILLQFGSVLLFWTAVAMELVCRPRADWAHWVGVLGTPLAWCVWIAERPSRVPEMIDYARMVLLNLY